MICLSVIYTFPENKVDEAIPHLEALEAASRAEPGCRTYIVHRSTTNGRAFLIYEQYDDQAAMDAHMATAHFQTHGINGIRPLAESRVADTYFPLDEA